MLQSLEVVFTHVTDYAGIQLNPRLVGKSQPYQIAFWAKVAGYERLPGWLKSQLEPLPQCFTMTVSGKRKNVESIFNEQGYARNSKDFDLRVVYIYDALAVLRAMLATAKPTRVIKMARIGDSYGCEGLGGRLSVMDVAACVTFLFNPKLRERGLGIK